MKEWRRRCTQFAALALALGIIYRASPARDREFNEIADFLATRFHAQPEEIAFPGLVNLVFAWTRPAGVRRLKMARFAGAVVPTEARALADVVQGALGRSWRPLLKQQSRRSGRQTLVYTRDVGEAQQIMLVRVERGEATLLQATLDGGDFARYLEQPAEIAGEATLDD